MALTLRYFDVYNGEWLQDSRGNDVVEVRGNTLLEALYPDLRDKLSACKFGDLVTPEDLLRHPDGHSLLFASNEQLIFGDADAAAKIQEIFPHDIDAGFRGVKDRIAYGSLLLGDCSGERSLNIVFVGDAGENTIDLADSEAYNAAIEQQQQWQRDGYLEFSTDSPTFLFAKTVPGTDVGTAELTPKELKEKIDLKVIPAASDGWDKLTILLVEDGPSDSPTPIGECGGILPSETAAAFAGDCFGRISAPLAERFGLNESAMQHRICLRNFGDRGDNLGVHKIGKGMVLPLEMGELPWNLPPGTPTPDLILPISSFKGGDKSTLSCLTSNQHVV